ncbi:LysR family transcriptional regulator [Spongiibacter taiwanensis]|uniref:LysR family transcriptional regulator n=1 Tax=Spongiibacter taiwanensis TaxID=1748242 RepID=UPI002035DF43|nr:LysR family transcriptional regulator [Spongiibacter taiwanensis]USA42793.1 LysR family transcriptional regulator [Spongiibacter taiwanensis]
MKGNYDISSLQAFATIFGNRSLSQSAAELELAKSTLSRKLRALEETVGHSLLRRESNRMIPTEAGHVFYHYCQRILSAAEESNRQLDTLSGEVEGDLHIHLHNSFVRGWFPNALEEFMQQHPSLLVNLHTGGKLPEAPWLEQIGVWLGPVPDLPVRQEHLGVLSQGVYAAHGMFDTSSAPRHPKDLLDVNWVDLPGQRENGLVLEHRSGETYRLPSMQRALRVDLVIMQGDAITRGGVGLMPNWLAQMRMRAHPGEIQPCLPEWQGPPLFVTLLYPHGKLPRRAQAFVEHIRRSTPPEWRQSLP